jgi:lysophospholipase L1-like esterase
MKTYNLKLILYLFIVLFSETTQSQPLTIMIIGDSTVSDHTESNKSKNENLAGWGEVIGDNFNKNVIIINRAKSGSSSKSFYHNRIWNDSKQMSANYLFIQFGHNDQGAKDDRATKSNVEFSIYLRKFINDARAINMKPVLITPVARRVFKNGKVYSKLTPYANSMIKIGKEINIPVIDLHRKSIEYFNILGPELSANLGPIGDHTHFSLGGARKIADVLVDEIACILPELREHLINIKDCNK